LAPNTTPSLFSVAKVADGMQSTMGDVRDLVALQNAMNLAKPEVVIHMAAQPLVVYSYQNPVETYATNVMGPVNLLESVRNCESVRAVLNVTTDKCYENKEWLWAYRENERLGGHDPYSNSKACSELVTSSFRASFFDENKYDQHGVAIASARAGNVIGGGDWAADRIIPDCFRALAAGQPVPVRNKIATRPWQHVLEPLSGYLHLAASKPLTEALQKTGATCIAYETVRVNNRLPLLEPMSEIAGRMSVLVGGYFLAKHTGGKGVLLGGVPGVLPGKVVVIGGA
jgi:CDP-glucose 4,6-dehydratase